MGLAASTRDRTRSSRWRAASALLVAFAASSVLAQDHQHHSTTAQPVANGASVPLYSPEDLLFLTHMIVHHEQALVLTALVPSRTKREEFIRFARYLDGAQQAEIDQMKALLDLAAARGVEIPHHEMNGDPPMAGMLSKAQMAAIEAATGAEFERLWMQGMIVHHEGALDMARVQQQREFETGRRAYGMDVLVDDMLVVQRGEITKMNGWIVQWKLAGASAPAPRSFKDVVYASVGEKPLALDVYLPTGVLNPPLLVWVHGGAWTTGSKAQYPGFLVERGFAVASVDFRSSNDAVFPANVHDIKASIRFLRAKASTFGYRADRIGVVGASSGGHLAALVGVTNGVTELEGTEGDYLKESSSVQAAVSYFGATDLTTILSQSTPAGLAVRAPALHRLFGAGADAPALSRLASPVVHVDRDDPPLLLLHGDQDSQMPVNQVLEMQGAFENVGRKVDVLIVHGADHVAEPFFKGEPVDRVITFLKTALDKP